MAKFAQYSMAAAQEALDDAGWQPTSIENLQATVCITCVSFCDCPDQLPGRLHRFGNRLVGRLLQHRHSIPRRRMSNLALWLTDIS